MKYLSIILAVFFAILIDTDGGTIIDSYRFAAAGGGSTLVLATSNSGTDTDGSINVALTGVPAGARLVATYANEDSASTITISGGALVWTEVLELSAASAGNCGIATAVFAAGGSITVSGSTSGSGWSSMAVYAITGQESSPGGATGSGTQLSTGTFTLTTTRAGSMAFGVLSDWDASVGARTFASPPTQTEVQYHHDPSHYTAVHWYVANTGTAGAKTLGITAPTSGSSINAGAYEVRSP